MIIEINPNTQLDKINQGFKNYYPFLKLEFFNKPHSWQDETSEIQLISQQKFVKEVTDLQNNGFIEIHYWQKTGTVEQLFAKRFKLFIQIYRQHGEQWVQTTGTDELSLEEQNEVGRKASEELLHISNNTFEKEKLL